MKTIGYAIATIALAAAVGCSTTGTNATAANPSLKRRLADLEKENGEMKELLTTLVKQNEAKASAEGARSPAPPAAPAMTADKIVGNVVEAAEAGYPCYMSAGNPIHGAPNAYALKNASGKGDMVAALDGSAVELDGVTPGNGLPIVVLRPTGFGWAKRFIGLGSLTGLPDGAKCWINLVNRFDGSGAFATHELHATFFRPATNTHNLATQVASRTAYLREPIRLDVSGGERIHTVEYFEPL